MGYEKQAETLCKAIKKMANNEFSLSNFESYLSHHFKEWLEKYADTPDGMTAELTSFASITE